jgi:serine/threonine protein kinase
MSPENWQQVKSILNEALDRSPQTRAGFLDNACRSDARLRSEVESCLPLKAKSQILSAIRRLIFLIGILLSRHSETFIGKQIGHYKIVSELGAGGMGYVFLAIRDDGEFEQKVALKIIKQSINSNSGLRHFYLERRILAQLEHPNIARLIDGGTTDDGLPYFVMEYVEGVPLTEYANEKNLNLDERLKLFREVCAAVGYAHRQLIVHRDLKPSNILVNRDGTPKLLDFGIAKIVKNEEISQTRTHAVAFTPEYASPEQIRGEKLSTATDIYSLGVILYELLTGTRPFYFDNKNMGEMIFTISRSEPTAPSRSIAKCGKRNAESGRNSNFKIQNSKNTDGQSAFGSQQTEQQKLKTENQAKTPQSQSALHN